MPKEPLTKNIYLIMGSACNLNCSYCCQHEIRESVNMSCLKINPNIYPFIADKAKKYKEARGEKMVLAFFGGEPLLYWSKIKEVHQNLLKTGTEDIKYSITTNGKLLNKEMVDYFNQYDFRVAISWDGKNVSQTRGYDALKEKRDELMALNRLTISAVVSPFCYPREYFADYKKFDDVWSRIHHRHAHFSIVPLEPTTKESTELLSKVDFAKVEQQNSELIRESIEQDREYEIPLNLSNALFGVGHSYDPKTYQGCSVVNMYTVTLNLNGKLLFCTNNYIPIGDIYMTSDKILSQLAKLNTDRQKAREGKCKDCEINIFCGGACNSVKDKELNCQMMRAYYRPMLSFKKIYIEDEEGRRTPYLVYQDEAKLV